MVSVIAIFPLDDPSNPRYAGAATEGRGGVVGTMGTKKNRRYEGHTHEGNQLRPNAVKSRGFWGGKRVGYRKGPNSAESVICRLADSYGVELSRRGYPDYAVIDHGEIVGFIEVKPRPAAGLKIAQSAFGRMCERHGVPFCVWYPGAPLPDFFKQLRTRWPGGVPE